MGGLGVLIRDQGVHIYALPDSLSLYIIYRPDIAEFGKNTGKSARGPGVAEGPRRSPGVMPWWRIGGEAPRSCGFLSI